MFPEHVRAQKRNDRSPYCAVCRTRRYIAFIVILTERGNMITRVFVMGTCPQRKRQIASTRARARAPSSTGRVTGTGQEEHRV